MSKCVARTKDFERCKNDVEKGSIFCRRHRHWWLITLFGGIIAITTIGANIVTMFGVPFPNPLGTSSIATPPPIFTATSFPAVISETSTNTVTFIPTITETFTHSPSPTATFTTSASSTPSITLPFIDDFSKGINPPWYIYSGNWITVTNGATITINNGNQQTGALVIDAPTLTNYRLRVDVNSGQQGNLGVVVRYGKNRDQNLMFYMNSTYRFSWGYARSIGDLPFNSLHVTGNVVTNIISQYTLEIDVSGNTFTAKVNGAKYDQFTMSGYETGGIVLMVSCNSNSTCPSFSNLSLEALP